MPRNDMMEALTALDGMLDAERHAIRNGEFGGLESLALAKGRLLEQVTASVGRADGDALARLRDKADANQRLLAAAIKGVRAAQRRLDMIRRASSSLNTYDSLGRAQSITPDRGSVERRA